MKTDIITPIDEYIKNKIGQNIDDSLKKAIEIIQMQCFPELDGIRIGYRNDSIQLIAGSDESKDSIPQEMVIKLQCEYDQEFSLNCYTTNVGTPFSRTKIALGRTYSGFHLEFTCDNEGRLYDYLLNYKYGDDEISFWLQNGENEIYAKSGIEVFINTNKPKIRSIIKRQNEKPINVIPDIAVELTTEGFRTKLAYQNHWVYNNAKVLLELRVFANSLADDYHNKYEEYTIPRHR